ncbi:MAG: DUF4167 domain-containing protein, partial [Alphaproteobacteria bacterium]|nr:DUF4167 domain-containing protein [Alphaproteobacteria bacterium]
NGPGARVRGNSAQIYEKYQQLARDAASSGDRVAAEGFYQHAEHYYRLMDAAGLNRESGQQDQTAQPEQKNGNAAPNSAAVEAAEKPSEQTVVLPSAEATSAAAAVTGDVGSEQPDNAPSQTANGDGSSEVEAKPARRNRPRRTNGSANGRSKPVEASDVETPEDGPDAPTEDTEPATSA